jgi:hypothetical protein
LWNFVIPLDALVERLELEDVEDWSEDFGLDDLGVVGNLNKSWQDIVAIHVIEGLASI